MEEVEAAFHSMDLDGDGKITQEEMMQFGSLNSQEVKAVFELGDVDRDGAIDLQEFCGVMTSCSPVPYTVSCQSAHCRYIGAGAAGERHHHHRGGPRRVRGGGGAQVRGLVPRPPGLQQRRQDAAAGGQAGRDRGLDGGAAGLHRAARRGAAGRGRGCVAGGHQRVGRGAGLLGGEAVAAPAGRAGGAGPGRGGHGLGGLHRHQVGAGAGQVWRVTAPVQAVVVRGGAGRGQHPAAGQLRGGGRQGGPVRGAGGGPLPHPHGHRQEQLS